MNQLVFMALAAAVFVAVGPAGEASAQVTVVEDGQGKAVVVTADDPTPVARYAAEELIGHIEKATGVALPLRTESEDRSEYPASIYVGVTEAARQQGLDVEAIDLEAAILRTVDGDMYVLGREEEDADPLDEGNRHSGTLFGVYELLERHVGVNWLWPGELGTHVPEAQQIAFDEMDEVVQPQLEFRRMRWHRIRRALDNYESEVKAMAFSDEGLENFAQAMRVYLRRHRMGTRLEPEHYVIHGRVGHTMWDWWRKYGQEHPEFFMQDEDGRRGHYDPDSRRVDPCLSDPDLHKFVVEEIWDGGDALRLGAKDHHNYCHCSDCMAWDEPVQDDPYVTDRVISNRYARFYQAVYELAAQRNPDVEVAAYAYMNYFPAPHPSIKLNENIYIEYVPWGRGATHWYPTSEKRLDWLRQQWHGWERTGAKLGYRPNWELGGYVMPQINTRQGGRFFQFAAEHGMTTMCLRHIAQFAVRGPEHYMYARLIAKPDLSIEQVRDEYFSAFGPAARQVEAYFDYWEQHNYDLYRQGNWGSMWSSPAPAAQQYPPEALERGFALLESAMAAVESEPDPVYADRVAFLQAGLKHAERSANFIQKLRDFLADPEQMPEAREALHELIRFRRDHEHLYIADYLQPVWVERRQYASQIDQLLGDEEITVDGPSYLDWAPVRVPAFLTQTAVGSYLGYGWYRTLFSLSTGQSQRPLEINFGGVDEQAWVYVNGRLVGEHTVASEGRPVSELWNQSFSISVAPEHLIDGENVLVVRTHAAQGDTGIHEPVEIFAGDETVGFSQDWEFRKDPDNVGVRRGWHGIVPGEG